MWRELRWAILITVAVLIAIPVGLWVYQDYTLARELNAELAALRASGAPLTWQDAAPKPVPDDQNAAVLYQDVFRIDFSSGRSAPSLTDLTKDEMKRAGRFSRQPTEEDARWLRSYLAERQRAQCLRTLREASLRPRCVFPIRWEPGWPTRFIHYPHFRDAALALKANVEAYDEHMQNALGWHATILRMSSHVAQEPSALGALVIAHMRHISLGELRHTLRASDLPPGAADELDGVLRTLDMRWELARVLTCERASGLVSMDIAYSDPHRYLASSWGADVFALDKLHALPCILRPVRRADTLTYLRTMGEAISLADKPYHEAAARTAALETRVAGLVPWLHAGTQTAMWSLTEMGIRADEADADIAMCRLVLALKAIKREKGAYPPSLSDLQSSLNWTMPADPFTGNAYVYKLQGDGFILYSLGPDLDDDGGRPRARDGDGDIVWECVG